MGRHSNSKKARLANFARVPKEPVPVAEQELLVESEILPLSPVESDKEEASLLENEDTEDFPAGAEFADSKCGLNAIDAERAQKVFQSHRRLGKDD